MLQRPASLTMPWNVTDSTSKHASGGSTDHTTTPSIVCCARCDLPFENGEVFVNTGSNTWHSDCFRCAQCFHSLHEALHYIVDGRSYCEYDFKTLYAPACNACGVFIIGRVIRAAGHNWHPECLRCAQCEITLDDDGVWLHQQQILCQSCIKLAKKQGGKLCVQCNTYIDANKELVYRESAYHPYHFECAECRVELDETARVLNNELRCSRCHDWQCLVCAACRHPIDQERSVFAVGKHWHVHHFLCAKCEKPFYGSKFIEKRGRAFCDACYSKCFADSCYKCNAGLTGASLKVFSKVWCPQCYSCVACDKLLTRKSKVIEIDMRPICRKCFDRFPKELQQRMFA